MAGKCPVCGETDPMPAWLCMRKLVGEAEDGEPCTYSVEGKERWLRKFNRKHHPPRDTANV